MGIRYLCWSLLYGSWQCKVAQDACLDKEREKTLLIFGDVNLSLSFDLTSLSILLLTFLFTTDKSGITQ